MQRRDAVIASHAHAPQRWRSIVTRSGPDPGRSLRAVGACSATQSFDSPRGDDLPYRAARPLPSSDWRRGGGSPGLQGPRALDLPLQPAREPERSAAQAPPAGGRLGKPTFLALTLVLANVYWKFRGYSRLQSSEAVPTRRHRFQVAQRSHRTPSAGRVASARPRRLRGH